mmetsp:Transcript_35353/g.101654  ORF Transcript_35353/g.101654 Transcript_35353/m.101654 type:complete len:507 (+) Transcript_35353:185-1705(+)
MDSISKVTSTSSTREKTTSTNHRSTSSRAISLFDRSPLFSEFLLSVVLLTHAGRPAGVALQGLRLPRLCLSHLPPEPLDESADPLAQAGTEGDDGDAGVVGLHLFPELIDFGQGVVWANVTLVGHHARDLLHHLPRVGGHFSPERLEGLQGRQWAVGHVHHIDQHHGALDVTQKLMAEADVDGRALDEAGEVGHRDGLPVGVFDAADVWRQGGEGVGRDLGTRTGYRSEECRLPCVWEAHQARVSYRFELQLDEDALARFALLCVVGVHARVSSPAPPSTSQQNALTHIVHVGDQLLLIVPMPRETRLVDGHLPALIIIIILLLLLCHFPHLLFHECLFAEPLPLDGHGRCRHLSWGLLRPQPPYHTAAGQCQHFVSTTRTVGAILPSVFAGVGLHDALEVSQDGVHGPSGDLGEHGASLTSSPTGRPAWADHNVLSMLDVLDHSVAAPPAPHSYSPFVDQRPRDLCAGFCRCDFHRGLTGTTRRVPCLTAMRQRAGHGSDEAEGR